MLCEGVLNDQNSINSIGFIHDTFNDNKTITINLTLNLKSPSIIDLRPWPFISESKMVSIFYSSKVQRKVIVDWKTDKAITCILPWFH